jgi:hypothetical protein
VVVIDITGVPDVDESVANHLVQTVEASRLMGASVIITVEYEANRTDYQSVIRTRLQGGNPFDVAIIPFKRLPLTEATLGSSTRTGDSDRSDGRADRGADDAGAERLGEDQTIAGLGAGALGPNPCRELLAGGVNLLGVCSPLLLRRTLVQLIPQRRVLLHARLEFGKGRGILSGSVLLRTRRPGQERERHQA